MPLNLISSPRRLDTPLGSISDVCAGLSQLPYKFRREDYEIVLSTDDGGYQRPRLQSGFGDISAEFNIGDIIYLYGANLNIGLCSITNILYYVPDDYVELTVDVVYTINIGIGYINSLSERSDYSILLEPISVETGESLLPRPEVYKPQQSGDLFVNLTAMIAVTFQSGDSINYYLRYAEFYNAGIRTSEIDDAVYTLAAKKQLLDIGGSNMWEFLLNEDPKAQLMSKFKNPVTWLGWQTNIYQVWDSDIPNRIGSGTDIGFRLTALNINGDTLTIVDLAAPINDLPIIKTDFIPESIKSVLNAKYVEVKNIRIVDISEKLRYEIKKPCANPIMIEWLNSNGVGEQWLFEVSQDVNYVAGEGSVYEKPIVDTLDVINDTLNRIPDGETQYITLIAEQLKKDQILALKEIKTSPFVYVWLDQTGEKKIKVIAQDILSTPVTTKQVLGGFMATVQFPRNFNLEL